MERFVEVAASDRSNALAFLAHSLRLDDAGVVRVVARRDGLVALWSHTGFEVLATRSVTGRVAPADLVCDAEALHSALGSAAPGAAIDPGFSLDSAWRGALPAAAGFRHIDDVPARSVVSLSREGARVARDEGSAHGPPTGLLDQDVLEVSSGDGALRAAVAMRSLFALTGMGFIRDTDGRAVTESSDVDAIAADEPVRIRMSAAWIRIDARYGSVYQRRHRDLAVTVL
ncbi:hypothetical protein IA539_08130 [Gordonia sp. zg691]|uniref:Uncharacterized protein n=1 Tax=Gordonia jinghuaiqii TaxID=2758710 RepID=A0A7D7LWH3_9ACTN|nr:hypothetical protein [Gordonia jinghuaiqii]MBD0861181.1 hypothetical protein [Gordonia jinghuaiqii]MCR5980491.1 hypothetical protein [Gordonia jinghuaiqii]QMT03341.1 hypothetical protein H1R19_09730 [Gordonia jinghuaiqii]